MANFKSKLAQIKEKRTQLEQEYKKEIDTRKSKIGSLAERAKLLELSDEFYAGLFAEAAKQAHDDKHYIKKLEAVGSSFLNTKRKNSSAA